MPHGTARGPHVRLCGPGILVDSEIGLSTRNGNTSCYPCLSTRRIDPDSQSTRRHSLLSGEVYVCYIRVCMCVCVCVCVRERERERERERK
jgi:hypothetical protein